MPLVTVFTPSHDPKFLQEALDSLLAQTFSDWEWVVLLNQGAKWQPRENDPRIRIFSDNTIQGVGAAKKEACLFARGEYLVELDHDDILASDALLEISNCFDDNPDVGFVYSQFAQINEDGSRCDSRFNEAMGWRYQEVEVDGNCYLQCNSMPPLPSNVSYIWFAPNHVRAFRKSIYEEVGGYDANLTVLDDQDLMNRLYQKTKFYLIDKCLYFQRVHEGNTQKRVDTNSFIQSETVRLYDNNINDNALAWAKRNKLAALDLGGAHNPAPGYMTVDNHSPAQLQGDIFDVLSWQANQTVGVIRASDFLEHIPDKIRLFNEMYRVLAHGGMLLTNTPSTDGRGAYQDPTHVSFYNENSFWYFTNHEYAKYVPEIRCRFQVSRLTTYFPSPWHEEHKIPYVCANLVANHYGEDTIAGGSFC